MKVVGTGGLAPLFQEGTALIQEVDPELTIRGLVQIYQQSYQAAEQAKTAATPG